jgi:hypothetical protein
MANTTGKKFGGRKKGTPNKLKAEIKELAQPYCPRAIEVLASIMNDEEAGNAMRIAASNSLIDRGYGKPGQFVQQNHNVTTDKLDDIEAARRIAFLLQSGHDSIQTLNS